jgi:histone deacetylase HOS3
LAAEGPSQAGARTEPDGLQIFYASLHDILSFPCEDGDYNLVRDASVSLAGAHGQFIENMHLQPYTSHEEFWDELYPRYHNLFDKAAQFLKVDPRDTNVPIFISCGFDASELEYESMSRHGRKVPVGFYYRFAKDAREFAGKFANGKVISVLEGGYSDRALMAGGLAHLVGLIEEGEGTKSGPDAWWNEKSLEAVSEQVCMTRVSLYVALGT